MASITFVDEVTKVPASWLNDVDNMVYTQHPGHLTDYTNPHNVTAAQVGLGETSNVIFNNFTANGTLTSTGAFTSPGIDDNATNTQVTISDTAVNLGGDIKLVDDKRLYVGTGNDFSILHNGANTLLDNHTGTFYITQRVDGGSLVLGTETATNQYKAGLLIHGTTQTVTLNYDGVGVMSTMSGGILLSDKIIQRPEIKDYSITHSTPTISAGAITFDYSVSNSFNVALTANITSITLSNPPASGKYGEMVIEFLQDGTGSRTVTGWPASVKWAGGSAPTITTTATTGRDKVYLSTRDGGTTWLGEFSQDYS